MPKVYIHKVKKMKEYLFETHAHTAGVSACAQLPPETVAELYASTDYAGLVVTNHMNEWAFSCHGCGDAPWQTKMDLYMSGYNDVKRAAAGRFTVLLGMEIRFYNHPNDYLVYGVTEDFLRSNGDLMAMNPKSFSALAHENGLLFLQAHPFRRDMQVEDWNILDGYEIGNMNPRHNSNNDIAEMWAKKHGKTVVTAGSDFHQAEDLALAGIYFKNEIETNDDLVRELLSGNYRLKK